MTCTFEKRNPARRRFAQALQDRVPKRIRAGATSMEDRSENVSSEARRSSSANGVSIDADRPGARPRGDRRPRRSSRASTSRTYTPARRHRRLRRSSSTRTRSAITGAKAASKEYYRHSGYPGGLKCRDLHRRPWPKHPERVVEHAVKGQCCRRTRSVVPWSGEQGLRRRGASAHAAAAAPRDQDGRSDSMAGEAMYWRRPWQERRCARPHRSRHRQGDGRRPRRCGSSAARLFSITPRLRSR